MIRTVTQAGDESSGIPTKTLEFDVRHILSLELTEAVGTSPRFLLVVLEGHATPITITEEPVIAHLWKAAGKPPKKEKKAKA